MQRIAESLTGQTISIHSPHTRGDATSVLVVIPAKYFNPLPSYEGRLSTSAMAQARGHFNPLPSHEGRQEREIRDQVAREFQSTPLSRGKTIRTLAIGADTFISIHSPHTRGDSISLQKSIRIYVSLHNKTMIHRFSELYKPLFCGAEPDIRGAKPTGKP